MINHHEFFHHLLDRKLKVSYQESDYMANFTEGDLFELWKVLQSKKHKYPIIWLQTGYKITHDIRGNKTDLNKKRFVDTFQSVLYPLLNRFLDELKKTNGVSFGEDKYSFITLPFNDISELSSRERDYGNKKTSQTATTESVWDAIVLEISLRIDNECTHIKKFKIT